MSAALLAGGRAWRLPPGVQAVPPMRPRPLPGAAPGLLGLALQGGQLLPVLAPGGVAGPVWLLCPATEGSGRLLLTGEALLAEAPADAQPLDLPLALLTAAPAAAVASLPAAGLVPRPVAERERASLLGLGLGAGRMTVPLDRLARVVPMPALAPAPGMPAGALGLGLAAGLGLGEGAPVLVLDPRRLAPDLDEGRDAPLLAVLAVAGRLYGLPCDRATPLTLAQAAGFGAMPPGRLAEALAAAPALAALAPPHQDTPPPPPAPTRSLMLARAGDQLFALAVEEVAGVVPPQAPSPLPAGLALGAPDGVVAHRGDVLPVADAGRALGGAAVLAPGRPVPLLRLAGTPPLALAVTAVLGLRAFPLDSMVAMEGDGVVAALLPFQGLPLPLCRAAALAQAATRPASAGTAS
ncbi:chemotaxis protein CheW [Roseomonas sp. 18066]|uniref:chemotaxis protein CheW n=1 Tax=Roseomonas sp. 18066 TaxID=2681412 RepID=UPI0013585A0E|nr:chemotaxis protein CheW [Roseomonas sp. 18066]